MTTIHWFRQDLRLADNPALAAAAESEDVLCIYILDDINAQSWAMGAASRVWLYHTLDALNKTLQGHLHILQGNSKAILSELATSHGIKRVTWNRCYEPWRIVRDTDIKTTLKDQDIQVRTYNGSLCWEPHTVLKNDSTPYRVFTPYYRKGCLRATPPSLPIDSPKITHANLKPKQACSLEDLNLLPKKDWHQSLIKHWQVGEHAAMQKLEAFIDEGLHQYKEGRNFPGQKHVSRLSPHLHWGEISPRQIWQAIQSIALNDNTDHFLSELGWREFSYYLLYHFPSLPEENFQAKFDYFPWRNNKRLLQAWQNGSTGYPIVDAGMRELWQTGYMHNRVRMIVGSFLVKNLGIHWHEGAKWFWNCLVDADLASNSASWQWIAGCGADAAPYFRIFNPVTQGEKFDSMGAYTRQYVPELADLPDKYLFKPWEAPETVLAQANIILGINYPKPIIKLAQSRQAALDAYEKVKKASP